MKLTGLFLLVAFVASPVQAQRVKDSLFAFYDFEEGSGNTVNDTSGFGAPLDLTIHDPSSVSWGAGSLTLEFETIVSSATAANVAAEGTAEKLYNAIGGENGSGGITIETWITPDNLDFNAGPGRIVTMSIDSGNRNFTLGQEFENYQARFRTTTTGVNGSTIRRETDLGADTILQHVVYTRAPSGDAFIYLDGEPSPLLANDPITGDVSNWDASYDFALGNELTWDDPAQRDFVGDFHMVAIYGRALSGDEVRAHFALGKDASQGVIVPGDFNDDGVLDRADFTILQSNFRTGTGFSQGDLNLDSRVDLSDFVEFRELFHAAGGAIAVPEPDGLLLSLLVTFALPLAGLRRQKADRKPSHL